MIARQTHSRIVIVPFRARPRRGIVLILVAAVMVMISLIGLGCLTHVATENQAVHVQGDQLQRAAIVASGVEMLAVFLEQPAVIQQTAGGCWDNPALWRGALVFHDESAARHGRFSVLSPRIENDAVVGFRFGAENESAKLNLAALLEWDRRQPGAAEAALMNLPGMTESIAAAILDWIDSDSVPRHNGAEADFYASARLPYGPRNGVPVALEELLLVRGVPRERLLGPELNAGFSPYAGSARGLSLNVGSTLGEPLPWSCLLTVHSAERNLTEQGLPRIDLNQPDLRLLYQQLRSVLDPRWAEFIVLYRQFGTGDGASRDSMLIAGATPPRAGQTAASGGPTPQSAGTPPRTGSDTAASNPLTPALTWRPDRDPRPSPLPSGLDLQKSAPPSALAVPMDFNRQGQRPIESVLDLIGVRLQVPNPAGGPPTVVDSPFLNQTAAMRDYLPRLLDQTTVLPEPVLRGRININLAPLAVLRAVPGINPRLVTQIIAARSRAPDDPRRCHATWLLAEGLVDLPTMRALLPYLTAGGDVFRAQVVGFCDEGGSLAQAEVVIDATVSPPRQVYYRDLQLTGRGFPRDVLGAPAAYP